MDNLSNVEKTNLANMLAKLKAGRVLTESEERRLREYQERTAATPAAPDTTAPAPGAEPTGFASSFDQVSATLGTTARQWFTYSRRPGFPGKTPQGYDLAALAAWKAENVGQARDADGTLKQAKLGKIAEETALLRIRREKEERKYVSTDEINELHRTMALKLRALLYSKLENEFPPKFAGCDALTLRRGGRALADEIVNTLQGHIDTWADD